MKIHAIALAVLLGTASLSAQTWLVSNLHPPGASNSSASGTTRTKQAGYADFFGNQQPMIWSGTAASFLNLNPPGISDSWFNCLSSTRQGGYASVAGVVHAGVWSFTAGSFVDLHPVGAMYSTVFSIEGTTQAGAASYIGFLGPYQAAIWSGSAASHVSLHPAGASRSFVRGLGGGLQVGSAAFGIGSDQAAIWTGNAASFINVNPAGASSSEISASTGIQHAGYAVFGGEQHALLWNDVTPNAINDIHPAGMSESFLTGIIAGCQSGVVILANEDTHAGFWKGSPESFVDLHAYLPSGFSDSSASGVWTDGRMINVCGSAYSTVRNRTEAILWTFDPDAKPTLRISGKRFLTITGPLVVLRGIANDVNGSLGGVEVKVGGGKYVRARGKARWSFPVRGLEPGVTRVLVRAYTKTKIRSLPVAIKIRRR